MSKQIDGEAFEKWWRSTPILRKNKRQIAQEAWAAANLLAQPVVEIDFNKDVILPGVNNPRWSVPVSVNFDGAEGEGRVWLSVDAKDDEGEPMIAIEGRDNARTLAGLLLAWVGDHRLAELPTAVKIREAMEASAARGEKPAFKIGKVDLRIDYKGIKWDHGQVIDNRWCDLAVEEFDEILTMELKR